MADLKAHSQVFSMLVAPTGEGRVETFARRLKALDTAAIYPLLLYVLSLPAERLGVVDRDQMIGDLESWLIRRFVCGETNKNYNKFFVSLLGKLKRAPDSEPLAGLVRAELSRSMDATLVWPDDEAFRRGWHEKPVYVGSRPDRSAMLLRAIETHTRTRRNEAITLPDKLTVEHLLPQKGALKDYPYGDPLPVLNDETPERCRKRILDTIGNLTLLTGELNAAASNGPFPTKVKKIVDDSDLRLNAWLRSDPPQAWSEVSVGERADVLFIQALEIWPRMPPSQP